MVCLAPQGKPCLAKLMGAKVWMADSSLSQLCIDVLGNEQPPFSFAGEASLLRTWPRGTNGQPRHASPAAGVLCLRKITKLCMNAKKGSIMKQFMKRILVVFPVLCLCMSLMVMSVYAAPSPERVPNVDVEDFTPSASTPSAPSTPSEPATPAETTPVETAPEEAAPVEETPGTVIGDEDVPLAEGVETPDQAPDAEIADQDVPLAEAPVEDAAEEIADEDVPLAEAPADLLDINDQDVPLAGTPQTGDSHVNVLYMVLACCSLLASGVLVVSEVRHARRNRQF